MAPDARTTLSFYAFPCDAAAAGMHAKTPSWDGHHPSTASPAIWIIAKRCHIGAVYSRRAQNRPLQSLTSTSSLDEAEEGVRPVLASCQRLPHSFIPHARGHCPRLEHKHRIKMSSHPS